MDRRIFSRGVLGVLVAALMLWLVWLTSPLFHWLWFGVLYRHLIGSVLVLAAMLALVLAVLRSLPQHGLARPERGRRSGRPWLIAGLLFVALFGYARLTSGVSQYLLARDVQPVALTALPETTELRYLPMPVAETYGDNRIQEPLYHLGDLDPFDSGSELNWAAPRVPSGGWNRLTGRNDGFAVVRDDGSVRTIAQPMRYGEGMYLSRSIFWQLLRRHYWADYPEVYYAEYGGQVLGIVPIIGYRFRFPVMVPYWAGVAIFAGDGAIEFLTPEQALADQRLAGQRIYPETLARRISRAWAYRQGVFNAWFRHVDQVEIPTIDDAENQMPYLLPTAAGPQWFVAAEPYGPAFGIYKMFWFDARTGALSLYELPVESSLLGPNRAAGYVRSAFPNYNWYARDGDTRSGNLLAMEPRPFIHGGRLYWMVTITTLDAAGITHTALVDAADASVRYFNSLDELQTFREGRFAGRSPSRSQEPSAVGDSSAQEAAVSGESDLSQLSDDELFGLLRRVVEEMARRR